MSKIDTKKLLLPPYFQNGRWVGLKLKCVSYYLDFSISLLRVHSERLRTLLYLTYPGFVWNPEKSKGWLKKQKDEIDKEKGKSRFRWQSFINEKNRMQASKQAGNFLAS